MLSDEERGPLVAKVMDFGLLRTLHSMMLTTVGRSDADQISGTYPYMPPEIFRPGNGVSFDIKLMDVFAFGILVWEVMQPVPKAPWQGKPKAYVEAKVLAGSRPAPPISNPKRIAFLIEECWQMRADWRPGFEEVVEELQWAQCDAMPESDRQAQQTKWRLEAELVKDELDDDEADSFDERKKKRNSLSGRTRRDSNLSALEARAFLQSFWSRKSMFAPQKESNRLCLKFEAD